MSTHVWPPISQEDLIKEEEATLAAELEWLLDTLQETLVSLKAGLEDCASLLSPDKGASTLALSSLRSENVKGFVTRVGTRIIKGDVNLKLTSVPLPRNATSHKLSISQQPQAPTLTLDQLTAARNLINASLDVIDVSTWTGDAKNADFISGQLRLLFDNVQEAKQALKGGPNFQKSWWETPVDEAVSFMRAIARFASYSSDMRVYIQIFDPPCPPTISFHLAISDAAIVLEVRGLEPTDAPPHPESITGLGIRDRVAVALGASKIQTHEELDDTFTYRDMEVRVKEKYRVQSQDPRLLSAMAKLSALEHSVAMSRKALDTVMGKED
ncbi:MAG: hypothetical protein M1831_004493 [Alyxoria varia]|nr:MAG: hypothetical protein M1831_004493 [Alyxoria varia]